MIPTCQVIIGDCREELRKLPEKSVHLVVSSPPYFGLRDYGNKNQIGLEKTPEDYIAQLISVFSEARRVLRDDGNLYLNLGDSYAGSWGAQGREKNKGEGTASESQIAAAPKLTMTGSMKRFRPGAGRADGVVDERGQRNRDGIGAVIGLKPKDLIGIPWRVALALQADGWWLREDIIWAKQNCMPESVRDRCTRSHEYIFHLTKSAKYFYDADAIKEPCIYDVDGTGTAARKARAHEGDKGFPTAERNGMRSGGLKDARKFDGKNSSSTITGTPHGRHHLGAALPEGERRDEKQRGHSRRHDGFNDRWDNMEREDQCTGMRNKRSVWTVAPANYPEAHFATFPPKLIEPCVLAGCPMGGTVLDPFGGSGTTAEVAMKHGRNAILIELNTEYGKLIEGRIARNGGQGVMPL